MLRRFLLPVGLALLFGCATPTVGTMPGAIAQPSFAPLAPNQGTVTTVIGPASGLTALAIDQHDQLYVADGGVIRAFPADGEGRYRPLAEGREVMSGLQSAWAIAVARDGSLWVLNGPGHLSRRAPDGTVKGWPLGSESDSLNSGLAVDAAGNAYVSMNRVGYQEPGDGAHYIARITPDGDLTPFVGQPGAKGGFRDGQGDAARFYSPGALAFDGAGNLYVADRGNMAIRRVSPDGVVTTVAGKGRPSLPPSPMPGLPSVDLAPYYAGTVPVAGLTVDAGGTLYFTGTDNRVHRVTPDGVQSVFSGDGKQCVGLQLCSMVCPSPEVDPCDRDGPSLSARFFRPATVVANRAGVLYVLDHETTGNGYRVRQLK